MSHDRDTFIAARRDRWRRLEGLLGARAPTPADWAEIASLYRSTCNDLARATDLDLGDDLRGHLDDLAARAHGALYGARPSGGLRLAHLIGRDAPREIRANGTLFLIASALLYGPALIGGIGAAISPEFAMALLPAETLRGMEQMYADPDGVRPEGQDAMMAGFYVMNNVGIALRCFATGALAGLGPLYFLVSNGLFLGTVAGYVAGAGHGVTFVTFVAGHSAWELTGVVIAGTAGLRLGWAMIETHGLTRAASIRAVAPALYRLVAGSVFTLLVAASIEGFVSAGPFPPPIKWGFGLLQVVVIAAWIRFGGRRT